MSERTDKAAEIINIGFHSDAAKAVAQICEIYGDALMDILESEVCCKGSAEMKIIAQSAVVKAFKISQTVKAKIQQN